MRTGYLYVENRDPAERLVRFGLTVRPPEFGGDGPARIRFVARFSDVDAALMQVHEELRRTLADVDRRIYRTDVETGIAAVRAAGFGARQVYLDDGLDLAARERIEGLVQGMQTRRRRMERFIDLLGYLALASLVLHALAGLL